MDSPKTIGELDSLIIAYKHCKEERKKHLIHLQILEISMEYVKKIASGISAQSGIPNEDLVQVGSIGLIKAIELFDPKKPAKFKTYAGYLIRGEIKHYLRDKASIIRAPRELQELVAKISAAIKDLKSKGFDEPSEEQIAEATGIDVEKVQDVLDLELSISTLSLDQTVSSATDEDELTLVDKIPAGDYQEFLSSYENKIMLASAINKLPKELREIIELSYYYDLNQREIAEKKNISQMQVSRRLKKAINKLYEIIKYKEEE
ncbi:sigma-70 family RNA polymerase sigma factor [bacterium]|nr:sigma-70 family RNA polymerase sigma factor [bacterium]